jgi:hypothetical protein
MHPGEVRRSHCYTADRVAAPASPAHCHVAVGCQSEVPLAFGQVLRRATREAVALREGEVHGWGVTPRASVGLDRAGAFKKIVLAENHPTARALFGLALHVTRVAVIAEQLPARLAHRGVQRTKIFASEADRARELGLGPDSCTRLGWLGRAGELAN